MIEQIDSMTNLYNKEYLKNKTITGTYIISIDLQKFKQINDTFGHDTGDQAICLFAELLKQNFKEDIKIHRSGDEFIIISSLNLDNIKKKLKQIDNKIKELLKNNIITYPLAFNAGICPFNETLEITLRNSDLTMYEAKKEEKIYEIFNKKIVEQYEWKENLIETIDVMIERKSFKYHKIPIYDSNQHIKCFEYRTISPIDGKSIFQYISLLRKFQRIQKIDIQCLEKAIYDIEKMPKMITIDVTTLEKEYNKIKELLTKKKYPMIIDINIEREIPNLEKLKQTLLELTTNQIPISINCLQIEKASLLLPLLNEIPITYLKIESNILKQTMTKQKTKIILNNIINMCKQLNITPIFKEVIEPKEKQYIKENYPQAYYKK